MNRRAFTLIELLGVIILIGIIAVITVPVVKKTTKDAKIKAYDKQVATVIGSAKDWATQNTDNLPDNSMSILVKMDTLKKDGFLENRKIINPINNKEMNACVEIKYKEGFNQYEYNYNEDCKINSNILSSTNDCIKSDTVCPNGTLINVKVNASENYDFYVIKDTKDELTLIMNKNLEENIFWITKADYESAGGINYGGNGNNEKGPLTALKTLEEKTSDWSNVNLFNYELTDDGGGNLYSSIPQKNARARLLTLTEAKELGCQNAVSSSCPSYLYENTKINSDFINGYWLSSASTYFPHYAWGIGYEGYISNSYLAISGQYGLRPVINISKNVPIY